MDPHDFGLRPWDLTSDAVEPPKELTPYQKLFWAILQDAIETCKKTPTGPTGARYAGQRKYHTRHEKQIKVDPIADARAWLMSDGDDVLGFVSICEYFGWAPEWIRKEALEAIEKAREQGLKAKRVNLVATDGKRRRKRE